MPLRRFTRNSSVSRCSVKTMNFSSLYFWIGQDLAESFELGLLARLIDLLRQSPAVLGPVPFPPGGRRATQRPRPGGVRPRQLSFSSRSSLGGFVVGGLWCRARHRPRECDAGAMMSCSGQFAAVLDIVDEFRQLLDAALEGAQKRIGRAGQAALEYAHGQSCRLAVEQLGLVVNEAKIIRGLVVESLFADITLAQVVAQGIGDALGVEGRPSR